MRDAVSKILLILTPAERRKLFLIMLVVMGMALLDMFGVASIMPFLALAANPEAIKTNHWLAMAYAWGGFKSANVFMLTMGLCCLALLVVGNAYKIFTTWLLMRFIHLRNHAIAHRLLRGYMSQPYAFFLERATSDMGKNILEETAVVVTGVLTPFVEIASRIVVVVFLAALLIMLDPVLAVCIVVLIGSIYWAIFGLVRKKLGTTGQERTHASQERHKTAAEALRGIKDIKILGRQSYFLDRFARASHRSAVVTAFTMVIGQVPRFVMETVAFGGILVIVLYSLSIGGNRIENVLPLIGVYAFAGFRLMPAMQQIFNGITNLRFYQSALDLLHQDIRAYGPPPGSKGFEPGDVSRMAFQDEFRIEDVNFSYKDSPPVLRGLTLSIPKNAIVGLAGSTGAGKTTLIDILLGLIEPDSGAILVDGVPLTRENVASWQANIGYVPQTIFLSDDTIARNIAFGVPDGDIDMRAVEHAASIAHIHDFITRELPQGYDTSIGEGGIRLSGGQRQRIGIARALYRDPEVLVLDEATSALDGATEAAVMETINRLARKKTIIMIAHRLSTLKPCDTIFVLKQGRVASSGTYEELARESHAFKQMLQQVPAAKHSDYAAG